jgi:hypothetical protein
MSLSDAIRRALDAAIGDKVRAHYAAKFGTCIDCARPLGGESPSKICVECHAARTLARGLGGSPGADA